MSRTFEDKENLIKWAIKKEQLTYIKSNFLVPYTCIFLLYDWVSEERKILWTGYLVHVYVYGKK
jgi:hypothetical protein